jgi:hypothetical protein
MRARRLTVCGPQGRGSTPCQSAFNMSIGEQLSRPLRTSMLTSEGTAYYVAVSVEGISGVAVFGTSDPPLKADTNLITAANPAAGRLFGSSWTRTGTSAESCL